MSDRFRQLMKTLARSFEVLAFILLFLADAGLQFHWWADLARQHRLLHGLQQTGLCFGIGFLLLGGLIFIFDKVTTP